MDTTVLRKYMFFYGFAHGFFFPVSVVRRPVV